MRGSGLELEPGPRLGVGLGLGRGLGLGSWLEAARPYLEPLAPTHARARRAVNYRPLYPLFERQQVRRAVDEAVRTARVRLAAAWLG